ncbi:MAG: site-specific integrase [Clostridia bacterium]|nr:site-specific integrase [Clostridia bacterium]
MAYFKITANKKGELQAKIQVSGKDFETGNPKLYTKRIYNTDNLTEAKFRKYAERQALAYEEEIDRAYEEHTNAVRNKIPTFAELAKEWCANVHANYSMNYYRHCVDTSKKFNEYLTQNGLADKPITEIHVRDVQLFLNSFTEIQPKKPRAMLVKELPSAINLRELARKGVISRHISWDMKKNPISKEYAERLCKHCNLPFDAYFVCLPEEKGYAVYSIKGYRRILRTLFNEAVRFEWIIKNPVSATKVGSSNMCLRPVQEKEVFSIQETKDFIHNLDSVDKKDFRKAIVIKFMLLTGVRRAEMMGVKWSDIDFDRKVVHIRRSRMYDRELGHYEKNPKTKTSVRDIPLAASLIADLKKYMDWFREADEHFDDKLDKYYIVVNDYRLPASYGIIKNWLKKFETIFGTKKVTAHGLRHTYCSLLLSQNVPLQTVSKYMGHSDSVVTLQVYSHFIPDTKDNALSALDNITE